MEQIGHWRMSLHETNTHCSRTIPGFRQGTTVGHANRPPVLLANCVRYAVRLQNSGGLVRKMLTENHRVCCSRFGPKRELRTRCWKPPEAHGGKRGPTQFRRHSGVVQSGLGVGLAFTSLRASPRRCSLFSALAPKPEAGPQICMATLWVAGRLLVVDDDRVLPRKPPRRMRASAVASMCRPELSVTPRSCSERFSPNHNCWTMSSPFPRRHSTRSVDEL